MVSKQCRLFSDDHTLDEVQVKGEKIQTGQTQNLKIEHAKSMPSVSGNAVEELIQTNVSCLFRLMNDKFKMNRS